ncbi:hypothetical protein [Nocardia sp. R6R-6]|uniref:hypothetical protein n=1 Tax=Nocardia sp. R6R-6 TaxID=3459303 RepID=UPI00403D6145
MTDRAIGLVHLGLAVEIHGDRAWIERTARTGGYELAGILAIDENTYMPITLIVGTAAAAKATVIIAPDIGYFGTGYQAITTACSLLLPTGIVMRAPKRKF